MVKRVISQQREFFNSGKTKSVDFRIQQLKKLRQMVIDHENKVIEALRTDLAKSETEAYTTEIGIVLEEINLFIRNLKDWSSAKKVKSPKFLPFSKSLKVYEPYGTVLIIAPWNYPFQLVMSPLIGAIAAGNTVVIKPSEISSATAAVLQDLIDKHFDPSYVVVVQGDAKVASSLLKEKFDYVFYTGGPVVGKIVMKAAAENLTPVTLELGGKSPCIVDKNVDTDLAAKRIAWGKFLNAGQTCVAPDYLLVHKDVKKELIVKLKERVIEFYGINTEESPDFGRIISERHYKRVVSYLKGGVVAFGGDKNPKTRYVSPTVLDKVSLTSKVMNEEIFGPILPVIEYAHISEAIQFVNSKPKPLALYVFSKDKELQEMILSKTSSGNACVNDVIVQLGSLELPFGGVGHSGIGRYHGRASFELFSNQKSVMKQSTFDVKFRYPPYTEKSFKLTKKLLR